MSLRMDSVSRNGLTLQSASKNLQGSRDVVLNALENDATSL